ncbi:12194_t:CDS:2, partial [Racocetra persica]
GNKYYTRSHPCTVALKQLKSDKDSIHIFLKEARAQFNCCHLYGVTKDPSTSQYMFAGEILRFQSPYSQAGDIYSLGIILWELICGIPAFSNRSHCVSLIKDICNGLRPTICHFAPPAYNDLLRRCWDQNPSERPNINEILNSIKPLCICLRYNNNIKHDWTRKKFKFASLSGYIEELTLDEYRSKNSYEVDKWIYSSLTRELTNSHHATMTYNIMKWKPDIPIHPNAVYKSRMISIIKGSNRLEISDIPY